ncbi:TetR/AcrR family transcriptional regulator C-terminal domain-containing protein [Streptomyces sp. H39-S7]|uniref:TetR/AcrR family transcriptional regulator C-terminal domain-containing protein n=1 Tax=Streptomyces sp. H39-S7 TaxID=3004357 RepID=UPI0022AE930D|nr:TetR/AcrR family transcriptional regulator C-terminal domain-containing protein [Streptomyces sp. H39-S7]MCZ4125887.1 TetR/AcrR family transcriptional regulator C-terminal domain-containing protein [Streptomyces sp. H39-S7]
MAIDKEEAARTALRLLDDQGLDKLTVRRVASELGVKAPALYWHFEGKRALLDLMTDVMLTRAATGLGRPTSSQPWWQWLEQALDSLRHGLLAHRDGARVALGADVTRALALGAFIERTTEVLHEVGFGLGDASRAAGALVHFVIGRTVEEQSRPAPAAERAAASSEQFPFPTLARALSERHASGSTPEDDFRYSLTIMLTGLRTIHQQSGAGGRAESPSTAVDAPPGQENATAGRVIRTVQLLRYRSDEPPARATPAPGGAARRQAAVAGKQVGAGRSGSYGLGCDEHG